MTAPRKRTANVPTYQEAAAAMELKARRDALRHIASEHRTPRQLARLLPLVCANAVMSAQEGREKASFHVTCDPDVLIALRRFGLVEYGTGKRGLTAYGFQVRRELREQDA